MLLKNSRGNPDFLMTASALTLGAVLLKFVLGGAVIGPVQFGPMPGADLVAALIGPTLAAYTVRRIKVAS